MCNNEISDIPRFEEVEEARGCEYEVTFNSVYGCPTECPREHGLVCGAKGLCFYDGFEDGMTADGRTGSAQVGHVVSYSSTPSPYTHTPP